MYNIIDRVLYTNRPALHPCVHNIDTVCDAYRCAQLGSGTSPNPTARLPSALQRKLSQFTQEAEYMMHTFTYVGNDELIHMLMTGFPQSIQKPAINVVRLLHDNV